MRRVRPGGTRRPRGAVPDAQRRVVHLYYFDGLGMKEIAALLAVSRARVSQIHAAALVRLRRRLAPARSDLFFAS